MITFPLIHPPRPYFRSIGISLVESVAFTESPFTRTRQYQRHPGSLWEARCDLPPMTRAEAQPWIAFLLALRGGAGTFLLTWPEVAPLGTPSGVPTLLGSHAAGAEQLATAGWTPYAPAILKAGDMIQIGSGAAAEMHQVLQDVDANSLGEAALDIAPRLRRSWPAGTWFITSGVQGVFRLARPVVDWTLDNLRLYGLAFDAVEALTTAVA